MYLTRPSNEYTRLVQPFLQNTHVCTHTPTHTHARTHTCTHSISFLKIKLNTKHAVNHICIYGTKLLHRGSDESLLGGDDDDNVGLGDVDSFVAPVSSSSSILHNLEGNPMFFISFNKYNLLHICIDVFL